jgi:hypothetical protein
MKETDITESAESGDFHRHFCNSLQNSSVNVLYPTCRAQATISVRAIYPLTIRTINVPSLITYCRSVCVGIIILRFYRK